MDMKGPSKHRFWTAISSVKKRYSLGGIASLLVGVTAIVMGATGLGLAGKMDQLRVKAYMEKSKKIYERIQELKQAYWRA